jgi:hypothetical protein
MFSMWMPALHRLDCVADFEEPAGGLFWVGSGGVFYAAALPSLSTPRATILVALSRQWPLHRLGLVPWRAHPHVTFLIGHQD